MRPRVLEGSSIWNLFPTSRDQLLPWTPQEIGGLRRETEEGKEAGVGEESEAWAYEMGTGRETIADSGQ